ncbi:YciI family protein [Dyadobacter sp. LHD-138]|uniref:YciI family protein n=1 Tax=Dyadobacter sp. LHD-138 TaxID=3071413 RepID=UPI0027E0F67C|nr:YciI family protein [Dyadobacter sp. LHD-138]MDQ6477634.1 YciI family protein [Dyadobacter sp. LHD-138]
MNRIYTRFLRTIAFMLLLAIQAKAQTANPAYNKTLADSLGADEYGMKQYVLVILKTGSNKIADKQKVDSLFRGHMANINRLATAGKLVVAGPMKKNDKAYRGIFILNVKTIEEANGLLDTDPAIKEKLLEAETFIWYGSAALPMYLPSHEKVEKLKI